MTAPTEATMLPWLMMTPLGAPVLPDVYMMHATVSGVGLTGAVGFLTPSSYSSSMVTTLIPPLALAIVSSASCALPSGLPS